MKCLVSFVILKQNEIIDYFKGKNLFKNNLVQTGSLKDLKNNKSLK